MAHVTAADAVAYVEGSLSAEEAAVLEAHVRDCPGCASAVANMRQCCEEEDGRIAFEWFLERPTCPSREQLHAYAAGSLKGEAHEAIRLHLEVAECPACRALLEAIQFPAVQAQQLVETAKAQIRKRISTRKT